MSALPESHTQLQRPPRVEVLMAGIGGRGVLFAGQLLVHAAFSLYPHVSWFPSYSAAMRGGPCECTTILSEEPIASPLLWQAETTIVMTVSQLAAYEARVRPGGLLIAEAAGLKVPPKRADIAFLSVSALDLAQQAGSVQAANLVLLGVYLGATRVLPSAVVEAALEQKGARDSEALARNREAFRKGLEVGRGAARSRDFIRAQVNHVTPAS